MSKQGRAEEASRRLQGALSPGSTRDTPPGGTRKPVSARQALETWHRVLVTAGPIGTCLSARIQALGQQVLSRSHIVCPKD